jgi:Immunity protein Imm1
MSRATFHPIVAFFRDRSKATVTTVEELDELFDRWEALARDTEPTIVGLDVSDINNQFYIGVGEEEVPLACGYSHAVGNHPPGGEPQDWAFSNTWQEVGPAELVPTADAREAARRWARTGTLPDNIRWES